MFRRAAAIFVFFLGLYGLTFHGYVDVEDVEVCYLSTKNLVETGSLAIGDSESARRITEEGFYVEEGADGRSYPIYPLAQLLAPVPFYMAGKALAGGGEDSSEEVVRMVYASMNVFAGALLCVVVFLLGLRLGQSPGAAGLGALLAGTCSMLWVYAQGTFADLPLALFAGLAACCLLSVAPERRAGSSAAMALLWLIAAGSFQGLAVLFRPTALLLLLPGLYYLRRSGWVRWVAYLLPVALLVAGSMYLDQVVFQRPLEASYAGRAAQGGPVLTYSYTLSALGLLFSDGKGLFMLSPILILSILAYPALRERNRDAAGLVLGSLVVLVVFFSAFDGWHGGWCWGPRYLLPCVPLVAAMIGVWLEGHGVLRKALTLVLVLAGMWIQVLAVAVPHRIYMTMVTSHGADLSQFIYYTRFSPVLAHQRILVHKLKGREDSYSQQMLFGEADTRAIDVTSLPEVGINRFNQGFQHLAWPRLYRAGKQPAALIGLVASAVLMALGLWALLRSGRPRDREPSDGEPQPPSLPT